MCECGVSHLMYWAYEISFSYDQHAELSDVLLKIYEKIPRHSSSCNC